jgi:hypothetical protein
MIVKTATSLAFAAACLAAAATVPAQAQPAGTYGTGTYGGGPQTYQGAPPPGALRTQPYQGNMAPPAAGPGDTQVVTNGPQANPSDMPSSWSARQNVLQSQRYDRLLETNRGFRQARMRKECGPISDPQLHQDCLASFTQDTPYVGSSTPRRPYRSESGR